MVFLYLLCEMNTSGMSQYYAFCAHAMLLTHIVLDHVEGKRDSDRRRGDFRVSEL